MEVSQGETLEAALIQMYVVESKQENLKHAEKMITEAARQGAKLIILPEFFTTAISLRGFERAKENDNGETFQLISAMAKQLNVTIAAGSVPVVVEKTEKLLNACKVFGTDGSTLCTYSKLHLVDGCDFGRGPGIILYENKVIMPGNQFTTFQIGKFKIGIGVCFDLKFPELPAIYAQKGCNAVIYTGAFEDYETGPLEWDVLNRARAIDNQLYILSAAPGKNTKSGHISFGHSMAVDPSGKVLKQAGYEEEILYTTLELSAVTETRRKQDLNRIRRGDMYQLRDLTL